MMGRLTYRHDNGQIELVCCLLNNGDFACEKDCCSCVGQREADLKLAEYEEAEEEGRLFITPNIKTGTTFYTIYNNKIKPLDFTGIWSIKNGILSGHLWRSNFNDFFTLDDIGKTKFLSKEEAEKALEELQNDPLRL